jgi:hypothetical protein
LSKPRPSPHLEATNGRALFAQHRHNTAAASRPATLVEQFVHADAQHHPFHIYAPSAVAVAAITRSRNGKRVADEINGLVCAQLIDRSARTIEIFEHQERSSFFKNDVLGLQAIDLRLYLLNFLLLAGRRYSAASRHCTPAAIDASSAAPLSQQHPLHGRLRHGYWLYPSWSSKAAASRLHSVVNERRCLAIRHLSAAIISA